MKSKSTLWSGVRGNVRFLLVAFSCSCFVEVMFLSSGYTVQQLLLQQQWDLNCLHIYSTMLYIQWPRFRSHSNSFFVSFCHSFHIFFFFLSFHFSFLVLFIFLTQFVCIFYIFIYWNQSIKWENGEPSFWHRVCLCQICVSQRSVNNTTKEIILSV